MDTIKTIEQMVAALEPVSIFGRAGSRDVDVVAAKDAIQAGRALIEELSKPAPVQEPDWSDSETLPSELWKNRLYSIADRLVMADGSVAFERKVNSNLRKQLETVPPAAQPAAPEVGDMFWNEADQEQNHSSIDEMLNDEWCNGSLEKTYVLQQANRLPNITVKVTKVDDESGDIEYEIIAAAQQWSDK